MALLFGAAAGTAAAGAASAGAAAGAATAAGFGTTAAIGSGITAAGALSVLSAIGTGASAIGQIKAGEDTKAMGEYNQEVAAQEAKAARQKAAYDIDLQRDKANRLMSMQRAAYAKAGVDFTQSGTPLDVLLQQAKDAEMDSLAIGYSGDIAVNKAINRGNIYGLQGEQAASAGKVGAIGTIFKGIGNLGYSYARGKSNLTWAD